MVHPLRVCEVSYGYMNVLWWQDEIRPSTELVRSLMGTQTTLDSKLDASRVALFSGAVALGPDDVQENK